MDAMFKKFVNTGVGYVAQGTKLVQTAIDKLVQENKISEQEGKKIVDDLLKSGDAKRTDLEKQFTKLTADLRTRVGLDKEAKPATKAKAATKPAAKPAAVKASPAKKPASSPVAKVAGATKKAADKVSAAASKTQHSAAAKAGAEKKAE